MKKVLFSASLAVKVSEAQRKAIEHLAMTKELSLGEATREVLDRGFESMAVKV
jgi:hypothetical protein